MTHPVNGSDGAARGGEAERLKELLHRFAGRRVLVVGDVMLDEYIWGQASRISPEAPVMVVDAERYSQVPGGAANVVNNLCALGSTGIVMGAVGDDEAGRALAAALRAEGAETSGLIVVPARPTTRKVRVVAHSQQVVRIDHETRAPLPPDSADQFLAALEALLPGADALILSDYQKGVLTAPVIAECARLGQLHAKPITGNLKPSSLTEQSRLTVVTLNLLEASQAAGAALMETEEQIAAAGALLLRRTGARYILITRGAHGLTLFGPADPDADAPPPSYHVPAHPVEVYDVAGAGDTVISTLTIALAAGASAADAVTLANYAAAAVVQKLGVATVTAAEVERAIDAWTATERVGGAPGGSAAP